MDTSTLPAPTRATLAPLPAARTAGAVKVYGRGGTEVRALDGVTVELPAGHFTAVMGPSGSGKSTLMHCLAGLDTLSAGQVFLGDVELGSLSDKELTRVRRERVGFVFQSFNLLPMLTALENITLPLDLDGRKPDREWLKSVVDVVGLGDRLRHRPSELSGGQQQRVAVARALASRPQMIFADEPTGNLDSRSGGDILGFMRYAVDMLAQTIVMVTHDPVAASYADTVLFLADGRIVDSMSTPSAARVLDRLKAFDGKPSNHERPNPERPTHEQRA
jgi:putative ABC transport system ATP-binding protein